MLCELNYVYLKRLHTFQTKREISKIMIFLVLQRLWYASLKIVFKIIVCVE